MRYILLNIVLSNLESTLGRNAGLDLARRFQAAPSAPPEETVPAHFRPAAPLPPGG